MNRPSTSGTFAIPGRPNPSDFDEYLPWACTQLSIEVTIDITRTSLTEYVSSVSSPKHKARKSKTPSVTETHPGSDDIHTPSSASLVGFEEETKIFVETVYDGSNNLVHIKLLKNKDIPRQVLKLIGLIIQFQKHLTSITINCGLNCEAIYEMAKFLPISQVTEICLDNASLPQANYHILLENSCLKHLSLCRCKIDDGVLRTLACKLVLPYKASKTLSILNLATNRITDKGAEYLADALRSNRQLSYLNLADNFISDRGATSIFKVLKEFPLTNTEVIHRKSRHLAYLKNKIDLVLKSVKEVKIYEADKKIVKKKPVKPSQPAPKKSKLEKDPSIPGYNRSFFNIDTSVYEKAEAIANSTMGPFEDPFDPNNTEIKNGVMHCFGNNTLCYLNLAYNDLTYLGLKKLHEVIVYQRLVNRKPRGIVNIMIEGNFLPKSCEELIDIDDMLDAGLFCVRKMSGVNKKRMSTKGSR